MDIGLTRDIQANPQKSTVPQPITTMMRGYEIGLESANDICSLDWPIDWIVCVAEAANACLCSSVEGSRDFR